MQDNSEEMGLHCVWEVAGKKKGKHVKLYMKKKQQEWTHTIDQEGRYALAMHTPDFLPGGAPGPRYIEALLIVYKNTAHPPNLQEAEELKDYKLTESQFENNVIIRDFYRIHSKDATKVAEFQLTPEMLPASIHMIARTHTPLIGMRFAAKLFRNPDYSVLSTAREFSVSSEWLFKTLSLESIHEELARESEYKQKAFDMGMIRPFMFLVSMHPLMRLQIADLLGIKMIDLNESKQKWSNDPHAQAWLLVSKSRKGLASITDHSWETANPGKEDSNWYQALYRGGKEIHREEFSDYSRLSNGESMDYCKGNQDFMRKMELDFLEGAAKMHKKEMDKLQKDSRLLDQRVDELMKTSEAKDITHLLRANGIDRKLLERFIFEVTVLAHYLEWRRTQEKDKKADSDPHLEEFNAKKDLEHYLADVVPDDSYNITADEFLAGLRMQLLHGNYDPRGMSDAGKAAGKAVAQFIAKQAFKYFILIPFAPFLVLPWFIYGIVDIFIGSDHPTVWMVSLQICMQRLLLATHGVSIDGYYANLCKSGDGAVKFSDEVKHESKHESKHEKHGKNKHGENVKA